MLSLSKAYVSMANTKLETPKPTNFEVHNSPLAATICLTAYQKHIPIGIAKITFDKIGLFCQYDHTN